MTVAFASALQVNPVRVQLSAQHTVNSIVLSNSADEPVTLQLETMRWEQDAGQDIFSPSNDILATPPLVKIPAHSTQVIRVGLRHIPQSSQELSYRLFLQEVLAPPVGSFQGLRVALRISLPVFIQSATAASNLWTWHGSRDAEGHLWITLNNPGTQHVQVLWVKLSFADQQKLEQQISSYVLPAQSKTWLIDSAPTPLPPGKIHLEAETDAGLVEQWIELVIP